MAKGKSKFIHKPTYPGGQRAMNKFVQDNLEYPPTALAAKTEGSVKVGYSLNQAGKVVKAKAVEGPKNGCRAEAERVVKLLRFSIPKDYKMTVRYHQHININFKLPQVKAQAPKPAVPPRINYEIKSSKPTVPTEQPKPTSGYGYTIKW
jgi:TonB family protein